MAKYPANAHYYVGQLAIALGDWRRARDELDAAARALPKAPADPVYATMAGRLRDDRRLVELAPMELSHRLMLVPLAPLPGFPSLRFAQTDLR